MSMMGTSLNDLDRVCVGNVTYCRASYWHQLLNMFDTDQPKRKKPGMRLILNIPTRGVSSLSVT